MKWIVNPNFLGNKWLKILKKSWECSTIRFSRKSFKVNKILKSSFVIIDKIPNTDKINPKI